MSLRALLAWVAFAVLLLLPVVTSAHALAPLGLLIHERAPGELSVSFKRALVQARGANVVPVFPAECSLREQRIERTDDAQITHYQLGCPAGLAGRELAVRGLRGASIDAVVRVELADGSVHRALLTAALPSWRVPYAVSRLAVVWSYGRLGLLHLLSGLDHMLFVLGLMWLVVERRRLIVALTAFTVGHSITLSAATLGWVAVPMQLAEVAIAASLMLLAGGILMKRPGDSALPRRRDMRWLWPMCTALGLLHGFGFAGALLDTGLPNAELPLALASFNIGIELGQLAVVLVAALVAHALRGRLPLSEVLRRQLPGYALGGVAAMWCIERALPALGL
jgi:hydrogenase/urease accessory protein HupE